MATTKGPEASKDAETMKEIEALEVEVPKAAMELDEASMDAELQQFEQEFSQLGKPRFEVVLSNPAVFTYILVAFASLGGLLSGLDQSLISGANLFMPTDLRLSDNQDSLVNAGMPLGAVGGALILSPANEYLGCTISARLKRPVLSTLVLCLLVDLSWVWVLAWKVVRCLFTWLNAVRLFFPLSACKSTASNGYVLQSPEDFVAISSPYTS